MSEQVDGKKKLLDLMLCQTASFIGFYAGHRVQKDLLCRLARHVGMDVVDGLPVEEWFDDETRRIIERITRRTEDVDPAIAAIVQAKLDGGNAWDFQIHGD